VAEVSDSIHLRRFCRISLAERKLAKLVKEKKARVRDRSTSMGVKLRAITRTTWRRTGEAKSERSFCNST